MHIVVCIKQVPGTTKVAINPEVFSNRSVARPDSPPGVTIFLLDALNTRITDQILARKEFLKLLSQIQPDDRMGVYMLGQELRVLQDFTSDSICRSRGRFRSVSQTATMARSWSGRVAGSGMPGDTYSMSREMSDPSIRNSRVLFSARSPGVTKASKRIPASPADPCRV